MEGFASREAFHARIDPRTAAEAEPRPAVTLSPNGLPLLLGAVALLLVVLYGASKLVTDCSLCPEIEVFVHLDGEANLPSWFSSTLWLVAAALAGAVAASRAAGPTGLGRSWWGLAALCAFLSLDEAAMVHERFGNRLGGAVSAGDVLYYNWLLYGIAAVAVAGLVFLPFLRALPRGTACRILLAGAVFLSGAIGVEMLGGASRAGAIDLIQGRLAWGLELMVEEFLEMAGIILLIHALLHHLSVQGAPLSLAVTPRADRGD